jgi:hypothetical protein
MATQAFYYLIAEILHNLEDVLDSDAVVDEESISDFVSVHERSVDSDSELTGSSDGII